MASSDEKLAGLVAEQKAATAELKAAKAASDADAVKAAEAKLEAAKAAVNVRRGELGLPVVGVKKTGAQKRAERRAAGGGQQQQGGGKGKQGGGKGKGGGAGAGAGAGAAAAGGDGDSKGLTTTKAGNFPLWYSEVVTKSELIDYYDVSGCYILRPDAYEMWEHVKDYFDGEIRKLGVRNCNFPMFISKAALCKEEDHVEGFAPEVAWVTKGGKSDLEEPIAIRPTSETAMYPAYARWIRSHRDLPLRLNQWVSVVRWEFKSPTPFIRAREFLWQEGHTAFATKDEAMVEVYQILNLYASVYEDILAVPVIRGTKTDEEKFPGGVVTTTVEAFVPQNGRAIQAATSHCLGQNFAKMYDVTFEDESSVKQHVWQNSWGITTRSLGIMIMVHGDDKGLVLPPRVAATQVVIVPLRFKDVEDVKVAAAAEAARKTLEAAGVRVIVDSRNLKPGNKYFHWEMRGVPVRLEIGPKDIASGECVAARRDTGVKSKVSLDDDKIAGGVKDLLDTIQREMLERARAVRDDHLVRVDEWKDFVPTLNRKNMALVPFCDTTECELDIKKASGDEARDVVEDMDVATQAAADATGETFQALTGAAKSLCKPEQQPELKEGTKCIRCGKDATVYCAFGRSY